MDTEPEGTWISIDDIENVPYHLRTNAPPLAKCSVCGRSTWSVDEIDRKCTITQPSGKSCTGKFISRVRPDAPGW